MRFLGLASLVLATVLGASNASAGYITIDDFDSSSATGRTTPLGGLVFNAGSVSTSAAFIGARVLSYDFTTYVVEGASGAGALDLTVGPNNWIALRGFDVTQGTVDVIVELVSGANTYGSTFTLGTVPVSAAASPQDLKFLFDTIPAGDLANITGLNLTFTASTSSSFTFNQLQAIPEPTTLALLGLVGSGAGFAGWRKRRAAKA